MKTPITDFLEKYSSLGLSRLHMPGHKGNGSTGCERYDITEVSGADVLYSAEGIIRESEDIASELFSASTFYSTEGSTLAIKAMLKLATDGKRRNGRPLILAGRNAHRSFISAVALLDLDVEWIYPCIPSHIASSAVTPEEVASAIDGSCVRPSAVYLTSPDYLGGMADVGEIAKVCRDRDIPLLVDNAHGAYLAFLEESLHPISLGASMCADSAHKTLHALTGGAYLHISREHPEYVRRAEGALSLFASTSPSYLILRSLDECNAILSGGYRETLARCVERVEELKRRLRVAGVAVVDTEPLKITVNASEMGYTGIEIGGALRSQGVECEFRDSDYTVMMVTPDNTDLDLERVYTALAGLEKREGRGSYPPALSHTKRVMTVREAVFADSETLDISEAKGRICASATVACPPAIPIVIAGEVIGPEEINALSYYGITEIDVVK